jgi:Lipase
LGAQVAGYAGQGVAKLGRITGLDPAGPLFQYTPPHVRLDPTDAQFVDAYHTNGVYTELQIGNPLQIKPLWISVELIKIKI